MADHATFSIDGDTNVGDRPIKLLGIGGSTRQRSQSLALLTSALRLAEASGADVTLADVRALALPLYDEDRPLDDYPASLSGLVAAVRAADGFILCSPTYHGAISGAVKNVFDALNALRDDDPPYFAGKPVALMAVGNGGAANVLTTLHHTARALNGLTIPTTVIASRKAIVDGEVADDDVQRRLRWMVDELIGLALRLRSPATAFAGSWH
jgi:FMN reductase